MNLWCAIDQVNGADDSWEGIWSGPDVRLSGRIQGYYRYWTAQVGRRVWLVPTPWVLLDISLTAPPRVIEGDFGPRLGASAVFGPREHSAVLERTGGQGILVELPPLGAYSLLGTPLWELTDTVVDLATGLGTSAEQMVARIAQTPRWPERFAVLDEMLATRALRGPAPAPEVVWAWRRLCQSTGRISITRLAAEVGWTRRHLLTRFREQIGLAPKTAARVIRFQHALRQLRQPHRPTLATIALNSGYSDQPHLNREFRTLAGVVPGKLSVDRPTMPGDSTFFRSDAMT
jgi:AraC-like DNA-binding protein